jgi:hypothetical protein
MTKLNDYIKMTAAAYKGKADPARVPHGWQPLRSAAEHGLDKAGYSGMAFFHAEKNEVVIASSGTTFNVWNPLDLVKDGLSCWSLLKGALPAQYTDAALPYAQAILATLAPDINVKFVGHSLGASLAEMLTVHAVQANYNASGICIDGPGAAPQIQQLYPELLDLESLPITHFVAAQDTGVAWHPRAGTQIEVNLNYQPGMMASVGLTTADQFWQQHFLGAWLKSTETHTIFIDETPFTAMAVEVAHLHVATDAADVAA